MFLNPEEIVKSIGVRPGAVVADFGAGFGHYTLAAAKLAGNSGKVYAIDIQKNLLESIKSNTESKNLDNVEIIWSNIENEEGSRLADASVDSVIISNLLFQVDNKENVAKEAYRVLKPGGLAAVIDWDKDAEENIGPAESGKIGKEACEKLFSESGFEKDSEFRAGKSHFGLLFKKV